MALCYTDIVKNYLLSQETAPELSGVVLFYNGKEGNGCCKEKRRKKE